MKTAIITVGKEVLTGKTTNTNLTSIASRLNQIGIDVNRSFVIDDKPEEYNEILDFINEDLIIFTGGLGPTIDDITRETVIKYFGVETHIDNDILIGIKAYFDHIGVEMKDTNDKQALFPIKSIILDNKLGTAPGVIFETEGKIVVLFPGPPHEMLPMLEKLIDYLKEKLDIKLFSKGFKLVGTGESTMEKSLTRFYDLHPNVNIAPYAGIGEIKYIFTSNNKENLDTAMDGFYSKFSAFIYGDLDDTLEGVIVELLTRNKMIISVVESCTGGMLASTIVNVGGSSQVFNESIVTYSNKAKIKYLDISVDTLNTYGAVSSECALEMSNNLSNKTNADITVSITGIAGPTGGTTEKPVGLVFFGITFNGETTTHKKMFNGNRYMIRKRATIFALNLVRKQLIIANKKKWN